MSDHGEAQYSRLVTDIVTAARALRHRSPEAAMAILLPSHLAEHELPLRIRHLLAAAFIPAVTLLGPAVMRDLTTADHVTEPLGRLVEIVALLAWLGRADG